MEKIFTSSARGLMNEKVFVLRDNKTEILFGFFQVLLASFCIPLVAYISIPLGFSPVPIVLQNSFCVFLGVVLGRKKGSLAVLLFLLQGACNLPVFVFGSFGMSALFGITGGYLLDYPLGAYVSGWMMEKARCLKSI